MKKRLMFICVVMSLFNECYSQIVRELNTCNVLYRGHKTKFDIGFIGNKKEISIKCSNAIVEKLGNSFYITAGKENEVVLDVFEVKTNKILRTEKYIVESSAIPTLYVSQNIIYARYNEPCMPNEKFDVKEWIFKFKDLIIKGEGPFLNDTVVKLTSLQLEFIVEASIISSKGEKFLVTNTFNNQINKTQNNFDGFVSVIDKNKETKHIFDYSDPFSLVSLLSKSNLYGVEIVDSLSTKRILKENPSTTFKEIKTQKLDYFGSPLINLDIYGNELYKMNEATGVEEPVLADAGVIRYDLQEISRLVVFEDTVMNEQTKEKKVEIIKIGFAKKYPNSNKYDLLFTLPYKTIKEFDAFKTIVKLTDSEVNELMKDSNSFYFQLNNLNRGKSNSLPKLKVIADFKGQNDYSHLGCIISEIENNGRQTKNKLKSDNFKHKIYNDVLMNQFRYGLYYEDYIKTNYLYEGYEFQLWNHDGSPMVKTDPITGEPVVKIDPITGDTIEVIEERRSIISYIYNDKPNIYLQYDFMYNDSLDNGNNNAYIESIIITKSEPELNGELITLKCDLYEKAKNKGRYGINLNFDPKIDKFVIKNYTSTLPCVREFNLQLNKRKQMNINESKTVKYLAKSFNLDYFSIIPLNLFGIIPNKQ